MCGKVKRYRVIYRFAAFIFCAALFVVGNISGSVIAREETSVIKVGCFPYEDQLQVDEQGNYSGYGFDYLREIARYTGWHYEFVDASWKECLTMLEQGEIDLLGAVMYSAEREAVFDFSGQSMISGYGVLAAPVNGKTLAYEDFEAFEGMKVGALKGNLHIEGFRAYANEHKFQPVIQEFDSEHEMEKALEDGAISAVIMTNLLRSPSLQVVATFGGNEAYFATTKGNTEVLESLNDAMYQIQVTNPYFKLELDQKYYDLQASTAVSFTKEELEFIKNCPPLPCVYIDDAVPISSYDEKKEKVQGISADVCQLLKERTGLEFTWLHPASASEAAAMLRKGEALLLPAKYYDFNWAEQNDVKLTVPYLTGQMVMITDGYVSGPEVVALYDQGSQSRLVADAVSGGAEIKRYETIINCMNAVLEGEANTTFVNSTIASYLVNNPKYTQLKTTPLYEFSADVAMAVSSQADPILLSVLNKGLQNISATEMNEIVLSEMKKEQAGEMARFLYLHPAEIVLFVGVTAFVLIAALLILLRQQNKSEKKMQRMLYTDALTGHPNYRAMARTAPTLTGQYALIYLDIHRFKVINDTFGYEAGDRVLIATSDFLKGFIEQGEQFARIHADTFVLLLKFTEDTLFRKRLENLAIELGQLSFADSEVIRLLFCGGVYILPEHVENIDQACDRANYAKDSIEDHFFNTFVFYEDVIRNRVLAEKELEGSMSTVLEREEFLPYYQPKVDALTERVIGAEALVRWQHPEKGCLLPREFLPFYEKNGFIVRIDLFIFEQVCRDIQRWMRAGVPVVPVSVNFSRRHMRDLRLPLKLKEIVDAYGVPTNLLEIEITETEELDNVESAVEFVNALKKSGFGVSIDDYGTGYSSVSFLQQMPLDVLKLDRTFIINAMKSDKARDVMQSLVTSMHNNGIKIMCEGLETKEQRDFVISLNCRFIQGYLYSVPLPSQAYEDYLYRHGTDMLDGLEFVPASQFQKEHWTGVDDFLNRVLPTWIVAWHERAEFPIYYISQSFLEGMGYSELEFKIATEGNYINWVHPDDQLQLLEQLEHYKDSARDFSLQYRLRRGDGSYVWIQEVCKRVVTDHGEEVVLGICKDITDMVTLQMERGHLVDMIPGGVGTMLFAEDRLQIKQATPRFYEAIGFTQEELKAIGDDLYGIIYRQDVSRVMSSLNQLWEQRSTLCKLRFRIQYMDRSIHWVSMRGAITHFWSDRRITAIIYNSDDEILREQSAELTRTKLELALELTGQAVFEYDVQSMTVYSHRGFSFFGIKDGEIIDVPNDLIRSGFIHPEDVDRLKQVHQQIVAGKQRISYKIRVQSNRSNPDAAYMWIRVNMNTIYDEDHHPVRAVGVLEDITPQKRFENAFRQEAQYRRAFTESSLMAYEVNLTSDTIDRITGSRGFRLEEIRQQMEHPDIYSELLAKAAPFLVVADDCERFLSELSRENLLVSYQRGSYEKELEYRRLTPEGEQYWNAVLVYLVLDQLSGDVMGYAYHRDISERKEAEKGLINQAARDPLTGIYNRMTAEQLIKDVFTCKENHGCIQAFLMLDLDDFKAVNDTYGHHVGDKYLVRLAEILTAHLRKGDIAARMGGDEFAVLLKNLPDEETAAAVGERIAQAVSEVGKELEIDVVTSVSIGIAIAPRQGNDFESLYCCADEAMYDAKKSVGVNVKLSLPL